MLFQHPEIRNRYLSIKKHRGHKKAIVAIARMLLTSLFHMLKNGEFYDADLYKKVNQLPANRELSIKQAIEFVKKQGFSVIAPLPA